MAATSLDHPQWKVRCKATSRSGDRCAKFALRGALVCNMHGGSAPQVRRNAEARIQELREAVVALVPQAVRELERLLTNASDQVRLKAAERIMDQAGLTVVTKTELTVANEGERRLDEEITALLAAGVTQDPPAG